MNLREPMDIENVGGLLYFIRKSVREEPNEYLEVRKLFRRLRKPKETLDKFMLRYWIGIFHKFQKEIVTFLEEIYKSNSLNEKFSSICESYPSVFEYNCGKMILEYHDFTVIIDETKILFEFHGDEVWECIVFAYQNGEWKFYADMISYEVMN